MHEHVQVYIRLGIPLIQPVGCAFTFSFLCNLAFCLCLGILIFISICLSYFIYVSTVCNMSSSDVSFLSACSNDSYESANDTSMTLGETLSNIFAPISKNFNLCYINAQSIPAHHSDILDSFSSDAIHAVLVSESWLKPTLPSTAFSLPNYTLVRNDRVGKRGGGIAIYLRSHIPFKIVLQSPNSETEAEYLFIEVNIGIKILLGIVYCPPNNNYFSVLEKTLENLCSDYTRLFTDLNTCLVSQDYRLHRSIKLRTVIESLNLNLLDLSPTHHTHTNDTLLDLIITSHEHLVATHGQLLAPAFSHHDLIYVSLKIKIPKPKPVILNQRCFSRINTTSLESDASLINWMNVEGLSSVDSKVDFVCKSILNLFDQHAPIRPVKMKHRPTPWFNDGIRKARTRRDRAFRTYKRNRTDENWAIYKKFRNRCNLLCRIAKRQYISEQIRACSPAGVWKFLKSLGLGSSNVHDTILPLDANVLNKHFTSYTKMDQACLDLTITEIRNMRFSDDTGPFEFALVSEDTVKKAVLSLKSKAIGSDEVGRVMISRILVYVLPALTHIVNHSLASGQFPDQWRKAHVIPLPKVSNPLLPNHFRPISILPFLSKVIETIVHKQTTDYLSKFALLNPFQSGFRLGHSTTTALLKVTEDIRKSMENSQVTILVLIDFSNAFNAVNHDLLLAVISHLNFSSTAIAWFSSYLRERQQAIRTGGSLSDWCELEAGVPQGGILSPLLFSIFINILSRYLRNSYHFYADDLQIYCHASVDNLSAAISSINNDLSHLLSWSKRYGILVNPSKCQAIIIGSRQQLIKIDHSNLPPLRFNDCTIPFTETVKNLGILMDANLNWTPHVTEVSRKFFGSLHSLLRLKNFLPIKTKISLVNSLLMPILDYADICCVNLNEDLLNKLDRLLNSGIRFIYDLKKYDHISQYRLKLKWLPIRERRYCRILGLLYNILNDPSSPCYLKEEFHFLAETHSLNLRSKKSLVLATPLHRTSFVDNSFVVTAVRLWNELPSNIKRAP